MTYQRFRSLMYDALECVDYDQFAVECGGSVDDPLRVLPYIWDYAHSPECRTIRAASGLSLIAFSDKYRIPDRTIVSWESSATSSRRASAAMLDLLAFAALSDLLGDE